MHVAATIGISAHTRRALLIEILPALLHFIGGRILRGALIAATNLVQAQLLRITIIKGVILNFSDLMVGLFELSDFLLVGIFDGLACGLLAGNSAFQFGAHEVVV